MRFPAQIILISFLIAACDGTAMDSRVLDLELDEPATPAVLKDEKAFQSIDDCPVTKNGPLSFVPPAPGYTVLIGQFWFGTDELWTSLPESGEWNGLPHSSEGYSQKTFWWSEGYSPVEEPEPVLRVTGARLDSAAIKLRALRATHAFNSEIGSAMLVGVVIPTMGCWEITGEYKDGSLSFVIWII
jgi:hypothetical protein